MPYDSPSDPNLPKNVKKLPLAKRKRWIRVWNDVYNRCKNSGGATADCEKKAFERANGVVK